MKYLNSISALVLTLGIASSCKSEEATVTKLTASQETSLDSLFSSIFPETECGGAVLIMSGEDIIYDKGFGLSTLDTTSANGGQYIDGDTFFNIASCSKQFTATAILQLASKGLISLEDKVNSFFPEYTDSVWNDVTIHHLLCHTSGIPNERGDIPYQQMIEGDDDLAIAFLSKLDHLLFTPGERFDYQNCTYILLSKIVERVTGERFTDYVRNHIFTPAGMEKAMYYDNQRIDEIPCMAHAYIRDTTDQNNWIEKDYGECTFFSTTADGGIFTSTHELARWERALRNGTVLDSVWLQTAWTPRIANSAKSMYGYGWGMEGEGESLRIYHTGGNGGFKCYLVRYPAKEMMFAVLSNRNDWDIPHTQSIVDQIVTKSEHPRDILNF